MAKRFQPKVSANKIYKGNSMKKELNKKNKSLGFTIIELLVCIGIGSVILLASITSFLDGARWFYGTLSNQESLNTSSVVLEVIGRDIENSGGGSVRSWMSIWVENSSSAGNCGARPPLPACNGADRITILQTTVPALECGIVSSVNATTVFMVNTPTCCMTSAPNEVMLVLNRNWAQRRVVNFDSGSCSLTLADGPMAPNDRGGLANWADGIVSAVRVGTYYADLSKSQLFYYEDLNSNNLMDPGENLMISDLIFQFQVGLGYDFRPLDGLITENPANNDEVLFNFPGEAIGVGSLQFALPLNLNSVIVGIATGGVVSQRNGTVSSVSILDGAPINKVGWDVNQYQARFIPKHGIYF